MLRLRQGSDYMRTLPSVLATSTACCPLGCQSLFLSLRAEETAVFEFAQYARVLDGRPEPIDQAFRVLALPRGHVCHLILRPCPVNLT